jgi:hypothetical protein
MDWGGESPAPPPPGYATVFIVINKVILYQSNN